MQKHVDRLHERIDSLPFVRADLHNVEIQNLGNRITSVSDGLRNDIGSVRTMQMWILGILGTILIAAVVTFIGMIAQGRVV